jgi:hypothetical protein
MRRFTILSLMGLVLGAAVAAAALRNADDYWAGGLMLFTALLVGVAAVGVFYHSGRRRANRLGFVVFGGGYFALAFLGLSDRNLANLPTTWLLDYVHQQVAPPQTVVGYAVPTIHLTNGSSFRAANTFATTTPTQYNLWVNQGPGSGPARWTSLLPGAANYEAFSAVGHCLFALVAGLLGMVIARRYQAKLDQDQPSGEERAGDSVQLPGYATPHLEERHPLP